MNSSKKITNNIITTIVVILIVFLVGWVIKSIINNDEEAKTQEVTMNIAPYRVDCVGLIPRKCMVINGQYFYDEIDGFNYQEGVEYTIRVFQTKLDDAPADASSYSYELIDIISQDAADLSLYPDGTSWKYNGGDVVFNTDNTYTMDFGCNFIRGDYSIKKGILTFSLPASTKQACDDDINKKEVDFSNSIVKMKTFKGTELGASLFAPDGSSMVFIKQ